MGFFTSLCLGIAISISSSSWFIVWVGLEINLLSFIPIISSYTNQYSTEVALKYFLIQALRSSCVLLGVLLLCYSHSSSELVITAALIIKIGGAPFHFWFIEVIKQLGWLQIIVLNTFQKVSPMILVSYTMYSHTTYKVIAYSSLNHIGWILQGLTISVYLWSVYFIIYSSLLSSVCLAFHFFGLKHLKQLTDKARKNFFANIIIAFPLISLAGLPPFSGFIIKLVVLAQLINRGQVLLTIILLLSSLFRLFFYFRVLLGSIILSSHKLGPSAISKGLFRFDKSPC